MNNLTNDEIKDIINALERDSGEGAWDHSDIIEKFQKIMEACKRTDE